MKLFYSYSHKDERFRDRLATHLDLLKQKNLLDDWYDRKITAGNQIHADIAYHFATSDIILLLLSPDFISSRECQKEMADAVKRRTDDPDRVVVIPVILRPCSWQDCPELSDLRAIPRDGLPVVKWPDQDEAFLDIYNDLKVVIESTPFVLTEPCRRDARQVEFISQRKSDLEIDDIFVFPNIESAYDQRQVESFDELWTGRDYVVVRGDDRSGRTVVCRKLFLEEIENGSAPLLLSGNEVVSPIHHEELVRTKFHEQFSGSFAYWENSEKVLIIDDFDRSVRLEFIEFAKTYFKRILLVVSNDEYLVYFRDEELLADFELLNLRSLGHPKQEELVEKWLDLHNGQQRGRLVTHGEIDLIEDRLNSIIMHNRIVPRYPFYVLSILQTFEAFMPQGLHITAFGHCYQALIVAQLIGAGIREEDIDSALNFLGHLSYHFFVEGGGCSSSRLRSFIREYKERFVVKDSTINRIRGNDASVLRRRDGEKYEFKYRYVYYFFLGMFFSIDYKQHRDLIEEMAEQSYLQDNAYILTFTIHHARDNELVDMILLHTEEALNSVVPSKLDVSEITILEEALDELPERVSTRSVTEERRAQRETLDRRESERGELIGEKADGEMLNDVYKALKNIEIIGQVLKNKYGSLPKEKIGEMVGSVIDAGLRIVAWITNREAILGLDDVLSRMVEERGFAKKEKSEIDRFLRKQVRLLVFLAVGALLRKVVMSLRKTELREVVERVCRASETPAHDLLGLVFVAASSKELSPKFVVKLEQFIVALDKERNSVVRRLISLEVQSYLSTHTVEYKLRHKMFAALGLKYVPNPGKKP